MLSICGEIILCDVSSCSKASIYIYNIRVILAYPPLFWGDTVPTGRQLAISDYQNITFNVTLLILRSTNITCNCTFVTFGSSFIFSHLMVPSSHCVVSTSYVTILLSYSVVSFFFFFFSHI